MDDSVEKSFAQRLASNEKTVRDRTLKKLRRYLSAKSFTFSRNDLMKLWKGLHYTMWMQDKPILQEELSAKMCGLLGVFPDGATALSFAAAFFATQANEWNRLDQWRMDKYMMLTREFLHATLQVVKNSQWEDSLVSTLAQLVQEEVMDAGKEANPDGLRLHLADIYLEELAKVGAAELNGQQILELLQPFVHFVEESKRDHITDKVVGSVFGTILAESREEQDDAEGPRLQYDFQIIAKALFDCGRKKNVLPKARRRLYKLVKRFKDASLVHKDADLEPTHDLMLADESGDTHVESKEQKDRVNKKKAAKRKLKEASPMPTPTAETKNVPETKPVVVKEDSRPTSHGNPPAAKKRKSTENGQSLPKKKKKEKSLSMVTTPEPKTPKTTKTTNHSEATPKTPKHVAFDLQRNSARGLPEFVKSAVSMPSPHEPGRSPGHGILKDSPGNGHISPASSAKRKLKKRRAVPARAV